MFFRPSAVRIEVVVITVNDEIKKYSSNPHAISLHGRALVRGPGPRRDPPLAAFARSVWPGRYRRGRYHFPCRTDPRAPKSSKARLWGAGLDWDTMTMGMVRTGLLLAGLTALFAVIGFLLGGQQGLIIGLLFAVASNLFAYWNSDKMVLRMYNAQEVDARAAPEFHGLVEELARRAGLPVPRVFVIDTPQPNAFATGRDPQHAAVAATTGLLRSLSREELAGVLAHELAHVKNRDTLIMTITATLAGALGAIANFASLSALFGGNQREGGGGHPLAHLAMIILAPLAAMMVQFAISRTREYEADRIGAEICGQPLWLASALQKIEGAAQRAPNPYAEANPATAHLFIINPLTGGGVDNLFSTHPSTQNRVTALRKMAADVGGRVGPWG